MNSNLQPSRTGYTGARQAGQVQSTGGESAAPGVEFGEHAERLCGAAQLGLGLPDVQRQHGVKPDAWRRHMGGRFSEVQSGAYSAVRLLRFILECACDIQMILKLVTINAPRSPLFPIDTETFRTNTEQHQLITQI